MRRVKRSVRVVGSVLGGVVQEKKKNGAPAQVIYQYCAAGNLIVGEQGFVCRATRQDYGWPFITSQKYSSLHPVVASFELPVTQFKKTTNHVAGVSENMLLIGVLSAVFYFAVRRFAVWRLMRESKVEINDTPVIAPTDLTTGGMQSLYIGVAEGFTYNFYTNSNNYIVVQLNLDHNAACHLVLMGDKSRLQGEMTEQLEKRLLLPVQLKGNFPEGFKAYCTPDKLVDAQRSMTPETMAVFIDFCQTYDVEVFYDTVYISKAGSTDERTDKNTLIIDMENFLRKNKQHLHLL